MTEKVDVTLNKKMSFDAVLDEHKITIDAKEEVGGENRGPRPKPLLLISLGGCTGMDVISILRKMRIEPSYFNVQVEANSTSEHPKHYDAFHIKYFFKGDNLPKDKLEKAVRLSQEKYCGVSYLLGKGAKITHEIIVE